MTPETPSSWLLVAGRDNRGRQRLRSISRDILEQIERSKMQWMKNEALLREQLSKMETRGLLICRASR